MSSISSWILSVVGIVIVGLLVDIILPSGKTGKIIKNILAIFSIFVFVLPISKIDIKSINFSALFSGSIKIDENFVEKRNLEKIKALQNSIEKNLKENGFEGVNITISGKYENENLKISNIFVDLCSLVLKDEKLNIDKYTNIVAIIKKFVLVKEEIIIFYE